ncbi:MAG: TRAM domain-containing protein [Gemmatimonadota bacterium]|nr:TRAM domain-containing protein [Gemmatimonadota bacterium]
MDPGRPTGVLALTVRIERLATGGDGVGRLEDGRVVFVPRTAPGDLVEIDRRKDYRRHARARVARLVESGEGRVEPRCPHYSADDCGGCQFQHLDLPAQRSAKRTIVADTVARLARLEVDVPAVEAAPDPWSYRSRVTLALGPGRRHAGFHPLDQPDRVFPLEQCPIAQVGVMQLWTALRPHLHLVPATAKTLMFRLDRDGRRHVVVRDEGTQVWDRGPALSRAVADSVPDLSVWWQPPNGAARVTGGGRDPFPATVFEQVHPVMGDRIRAWAVEQLGKISGWHVWDLFAGIGETSLELLAGGATVESVELDRRAVELAERRSGTPTQRPGGGDGIRRHTGRVEELAGRLRRPDAVIANPPRGGLEAAAVEALVSRPARRLVYVSCDPATLARDLAQLAGAYQLTRLQPFDLFPQTAHVETVAVLEGR